MRPPFPGMDPWLEHPVLWPDVHNSLITAIRDALAPMVMPRYFVGVESRTTVLNGLDVDLIYRPDVSILSRELPTEPRGPGVAVLERTDVKPFDVVVPIDDEVEETFLAIHELPGRKLVTVIEVLSPTSKKTTDARREYLAKRLALIRCKVNLVEIDLLRAGEPMAMDPVPHIDYRILVSRGWEHPHATLHPFGIREAIPAISVPLKWGEPEVQLAVGELLAQVYDRARYDLRTDYRTAPPEPALSPEDTAWVDTLLREKGLRAEGS
jgi:hypothetical protein